MYIEQLYTNCLAEAAYYIESNGEAAIIDPLRETDPYLALAEKRGASIKYVFETHFHADFVSGHLDLARKVNAPIVYGPKAETNYQVYNAKDGEEFSIGKIRIKVLHTPGHTPESSCYLLLDENGKPNAVFTGDTLFVGDVGRPDLLDGVMTVEQLASMLYDSLNNKIKTLPDDVIVYPAHGPGSACGKNIGKETFSTVGAQKQFNYALQDMSKENFVKVVTEGLSAAPQYFTVDAMLNKNGYENIDIVIHNNCKPLSVKEFEALIKTGALILDTRTPDEFEKGFIPGSLNIGLNGQFGPWVGELINPDAELILVCDKDKEQETVLRLARVGYEKVKGYLQGGIAAWASTEIPVNTIHSVTAEEFVSKNATTGIIDVRRPGEWESGVLQGATLITLSELEKSTAQIDKNKHYYIHCAGGYRSMIAASLLKRKGFNSITNIRGGMAKLKEAGAVTYSLAL